MLTGSRLRLHTPHCFAFTRCGGKYKNSLYFNIEKLFGKLTTRLIAVSYSEADIAVNSQIIPAHKCIVIENGLSEELTSCNELKAGNGSISKASLGINNETKIVATICRLIDYKGITRFLEAATYSNTPDTMFLIVGDGEFRNQAEKYIKEYSLENKVRLLGHITEIEELYAISNIVTLCSDSEAQPYVLLEAMKAKRPIVATSVSGNSDLVKNNNTGVLVEPESKKIAVAIDELLSDEQKCNRYTENAYEYFHKYHTLEKQISKLTETYLSLISENNNGSK